jgi:hypothetical protein
MNRRFFATFVCAGAMSLCACSSGGSGAPGALSQIPAYAGQAASWMARGAASQNLLYVSDIGTNSVDIYPYPSGKLVGKLTGFGSVAGLCADKSGDVFVVDEAGPVDVYAHGGTSPIRKLTTSGAPEGCAIDPTTGDLALTNLSSYLYGTIAIYPKAMGRPKAYKDDNVDSTFFCGYDNAGNLFVDGWNRSANPILLELAKKGKSLGMFDLNPNDKNPGGVQWDGKYVAVGNKGGGVIYRIDSTGKTAQTITLKDGLNVEQFWLDGSTLIGPNFQGDGPVAYWHYPAGGSPTRKIIGFSEPFGATVSSVKSF